MFCLYFQELPPRVCTYVFKLLQMFVNFLREIPVKCIHITCCFLSPFNVLLYATATEVLSAMCCLRYCYKLNLSLVLMSDSTWTMTLQIRKCFRSFAAVQNICGSDRIVALHSHLVKAPSLAWSLLQGRQAISMIYVKARLAAARHAVVNKQAAKLMKLFTWDQQLAAKLKLINNSCTWNSLAYNFH